MRAQPFDLEPPELGHITEDVVREFEKCVVECARPGVDPAEVLLIDGRIYIVSRDFVYSVAAIDKQGAIQHLWLTPEFFP